GGTRLREGAPLLRDGARPWAARSPPASWLRQAQPDRICCPARSDLLLTPGGDRGAPGPPRAAGQMQVLAALQVCPAMGQSASTLQATQAVLSVLQMVLPATPAQSALAVQPHLLAVVS